MGDLSPLSSVMLSKPAMPMRKPASKRKTPGGDKEAASSDAVVPPHPCREQLVSLTEKDWDALWYASDCSGLDGGAFAMNRLAPGEFRHWFGSEIHAPFQRIFKLLHPECENVFGDVGQRANDKLKAERTKNPNACFVYTQADSHVSLILVMAHVMGRWIHVARLYTMSWQRLRRCALISFCWRMSRTLLLTQSSGRSSRRSWRS